MIHRLHRLPGRARSGFTVVETCVAACVLTVAVSGLIGAMVTATSLRRVNEETAIAERAAERMLETIRSAPFSEAFRTFNSTSDDDAGLLLGGQPATFGVPGLDPQVGDADGLCGEIDFPTQDVGGVLQLREDVVDAALQMPRDLDRDGMIDSADHSANYLVLPVRVRVRWRGVSGNRELTLESALCGR